MIRKVVRLPRIGERIVKTAVAVFICLVINHLRGFRAGEMSSEAAITAVICMQPYVSTAREYAISRFIATLIGTVWGLGLLVILYSSPFFASHYILIYLLIALGVLLCIHSTLVIRMPDTSSLAVIIFIGMVIAFPNIANPIPDTINRMADILIGTAVAIIVNIIELPRIVDPNQIFFINTSDLSPGYLSQASPSVIFALHRLIADKAMICLQSRHAPAFLSLPSSEGNIKMPMIVMDGAAIFDPEDNRYIWVEHISLEDVEKLAKTLEGYGISYSVYTIHRQRVNIFHMGEIRPEEQIVYDRMKRSPYRSYLDGEVYDPSEVVYFKIIVNKADAEAVEKTVRNVVESGSLRMALYPQDGAKDLAALYIYSAFAEMERARKYLMDFYHEDYPDMRAVIMSSAHGYRDERDAMHLLRKVRDLYKPVKFLKE